MGTGINRRVTPGQNRELTMASEQPQGQTRRGGSGRGRRGSERRGPRRQPRESSAPRTNVDVEAIIGELRAKVAEQHGLELSKIQIEELAARRLDAVLEPRDINPRLLDLLREEIGTTVTSEMGTKAPPVSVFEEADLYESSIGFLRFMRRVFRPLLLLLLNPLAVARAIGNHDQARVETGKREALRLERQTEWNALYYELIRRMVTEQARLSLEGQQFVAHVESLSAKVDFNERRVRQLEGELQDALSQLQGSGGGVAARRPASPACGGNTSGESATTPEVRRRRRRRRGKRGGVGDEVPQEPTGASTQGQVAEDGAAQESTPVVTPESPPATPEFQLEPERAPESPAPAPMPPSSEPETEGS